ncbi:MAG: tetratricopeptide repeat protein [Nitrospirae bacterium]|nr:tetratricopeptide repeat protein [Nitrospirota bacterium]
MSIIHEALKKAAEDETSKPAVEGPQQVKFSAAAALPLRNILIRTGLLLCVIGGLYLAYLEREGLSRVFSSKTVPSTAEPSASSIRSMPAAASTALPENPARVDPVRWPERAADHEKSGVSYYEQGRWAEAEREFLTATSLDPKSPRIQNNLGLVLKRQGRDSEAESRFRSALQIDPANVQAMNNLGLLYEQQNRLEEARRLYEKAVATQPSFPDAHLNYAVLLERAGYFEESKRHYQAFLSTAARQHDQAVSLVKKHLDHLP